MKVNSSFSSNISNGVNTKILHCAIDIMLIVLPFERLSRMFLPRFKKWKGQCSRPCPTVRLLFATAVLSCSGLIRESTCVCHAVWELHKQWGNRDVTRRQRPCRDLGVCPRLRDSSAWQATTSYYDNWTTTLDCYPPHGRPVCPLPRRPVKTSPGCVGSTIARRGGYLSPCCWVKYCTSRL